ncbi:MAG: hypothetical protein PF638_07515 [Candidatus Delongbacteria bacterium]|jgi:hypothetical protein|nr:hypothetical protein [Candidatus Delongbacteria bacterium]
MKKISFDEKFLLLTKENDSKRFFTSFIGYSALFFVVLAVISVLFAPFLGDEALGNFVPNMFIKIFLGMIAAITSSGFLWQSHSELLHYPDKSNEKAMWLQILSLGVFGIAFVLPMFNIDYVGESFGQIFSHHLFNMLTLGPLVGYISWKSKDFKKIKEIVGDTNRIM